MLRHLALAALLASCGSVSVQAQTAASQPEIAALIAHAAATIAHDAPVLVQPVLAFGSYKADLEYRQGATGSAIHETQDEMFHVLEGSGTLVTGGTLGEPKRADAHNMGGTRIDGGRARHVAAGDVFVVPAGTPHWFNQIDGHLVMIAMKLPEPAK